MQKGVVIQVDILNNLRRISIITGHYGSGKTNISVNMAINLAKAGKKVTIVDLDIVNPYFRTADFKKLLESYDINVILPIYANTNLDLPALPAQINSIFDQTDSYVIIDVGGDDAGAIALGRYSNQIKKQNFDLFYVINECRFQTKEASEAVTLLKDIEASSRLKATKLINNTNLGEETTLDTVLDSKEFAQDVSRLTALPVEFTCLNKKFSSNENGILPIDIFVKPFYI